MSNDTHQWLCEYSDFQDLHQMLSKITIPNYRERFKGITENRCLIFGLIKNRITREYGLSAASKKYDSIYREVIRIGNLICPFHFTTVHLNKNVVCPRHKDRLINQSQSLIVSFGEYKGCTLMVELEEGLATECDCRHRPIIFDGRQYYHWNTPLESGTKYSLVYYNILPQQSDVVTSIGSSFPKNKSEHPLCFQPDELSKLHLLVGEELEHSGLQALLFSDSEPEN